MGGRQFGPYRLVQQIAVGGMAEIHLARTDGIAGFEKYVALKMIHPNFSQDEQFIQMLIDEAKITVQLQHVNVAQTFDLGRVGDTFYITMEFVDGCDLYQLLRRAAERDLETPFDIAAFVAKEVASGLDYAHRKRDHSGRPLGIVHRDVSPQNVLLSHAGEVKLVDFGIAKATMRARQTAVGVIKGKYYYMSPEQAWGENVDHRSDIFSAGILLYEALTGRMLYLEEDVTRLLHMVRRAEIAPPTVLRDGIPPQLERIVMHALQRRPEDRYQTAADLAADLERFLHVYSPVFTASKLARYTAEVMGEPPPVLSPDRVPPDPVRSARHATRRVSEADLVRSRDEFTDENSVIFNIHELAGAPDSGRFQPRAAGMTTREVLAPAGDDDFDERTLVDMGPPAFGPGVATITTELHEHEPQGLGPGASRADDAIYDDAADDAPTLSRGAVPVDAFAARSPPGADPLEAETLRHVGKRDSPALSADVLGANNPSPAESLVHAPRESRRTPARGIPVAPSPALPPDPFAPAAPLPRPQLHPPPGPPGPVEFNTDRLAQLEAEAIPDAFKVGRGGVPRWVWRALAAACIAIAIGIGATLLEEPALPPSGALELVSIPPGATISIDGRDVPGRAPVVIPDLAPGASYVIAAELEGYQRWEHREPIPAEGGTVKRIAALKPVVVTLHVESTPPGAEVFLNNRSVGRTPLTVPRLDPQAAEVIEVRHRGFRPQRRTLDWRDKTEQRQQFTLSE